MKVLVTTRDNLRDINKNRIVNDDLKSLFAEASEKA
jgi:hypothetical protein